MFSINLYSKIEGTKEKEDFDDLFFKSIALYQGVSRIINKDKTKVVIFKNKILENSIQNSLSKEFKFKDDFFDALFDDLDSILTFRHLKIANIGLLKRDKDNNIFFELEQF